MEQPDRPSQPGALWLATLHPSQPGKRRRTTGLHIPNQLITRMRHTTLFTGWLLLLICCLGGCSRKAVRQEQPLTVTWRQLADLPAADGTVSLGVSAPFAGISNGKLLVAGGCNFADIPVAEGGQKVYYSDIYALDLAAGPSAEWKQAGRLPQPLAYGASVTTPQGVICIGGNNRDSSSTAVFVLYWNVEEKRAEMKSLPNLPAPMDNLSAAYTDHRIYVAGGNTRQVAANTFLCKDMSQSADSSWETLPCFPGSARVQPVLTAQHTKEGICLFLAGGFQPIAENLPGSISTDVISYQPTTQSWKKETQLPPLADGALRSITGGCSVAFGDSSILYLGGVNYDCFLQAMNRPILLERAKQAGRLALVDTLQAESNAYLRHPVAWYRFNTAFLRYNTFTREWSCAGEYEPLARAGAGCVFVGDSLIIINGELKPGIRTPEVHCALLQESE